MDGGGVELRMLWGVHNVIRRPHEQCPEYLSALQMSLKDCGRITTACCGLASVAEMLGNDYFLKGG